MVSKAQKIRLAVFLIIGFTILLSIIIMLLGSKITEKRDIYQIVYEDTSVAGLQIGGAVLYRGIRIGRIEEIEIDRNNISNIIVKISIKHETPVKADQEATLVAVGITGLKQIELSGGTNESAFLKPGDTILAGKSLFDNISDKAEVLAVKIEQIMDNIINITHKSNQEKLDNIISNIDLIIADSQKPLTQTMKNIDEITSELALATVTANDILSKLDYIIDSDKISNILTNTETITTNIAGVDIKNIEAQANITITRLNDAILKATNMISRLDAIVQKNSPDINATIEELRETIENLNEFTRLITDDPSILIRSRRTN